MMWYVSLIYDKPDSPALVATVNSLRQLGFTNTIHVFTALTRGLPKLSGVVYRTIKNKLTKYHIWRRAIREVSKKPAGGRYLFIEAPCVFSPRFKTVLDGDIPPADVYCPHTSEDAYTAHFSWTERPTNVWFTPGADSPSGSHCLVFNSLAVLQRLDAELPPNSWDHRTVENYILEDNSYTKLVYYPSLCSPVELREFTVAPLREGIRKRRRFIRNSKLRVGFIVQVLLVGGTETWLLNMLRGLLRYADVELTGVVVAGAPGSANANTVAEVAQLCPVYTESRLSNATCVSSYQGITELCERSDVVVVWAITDHVDITALSRTSCRVVGVNHGCFDWWMRRIDAYVDAWVTVSQVSRGALPREGYVINNGLSFMPSSENKLAARERLGLPASTFVCGYIGRLSPEKRIVEICRAFDRLPADKYSLMIVGPPSSVVDYTKFAGNNFFVFPATTDVRGYLAACDCTVLASESEGFGFAPLESILAGVPVVATRVGILHELMSKFPDSFVEIKQVTNASEIDIKTPIELARQSVLRLRRHMPALLNYVRQQLSVDNMVDSWRSFLRRVCEDAL